MSPADTPLPILSLIFWVAFGASLLFMLPLYRLLLAVKSRQIVSEYVEEHLKKQGTPTMGGLIVVPGFFAACGVSISNGLASGPSIYAPMLLFVGFAFIGFLDDYIVPRAIKGKRGLGWKQKLLLEIGFAVWAALWMRHGHFGYGVILTVFLILFYSNAYNFVDGMDGLAGTVLLLFAGGLTSLAVFEMRPEAYMILPVALVGAIVPFLILNMPPARIFMGDVGALPIGAVLGFLVDDLLRPGIVRLPHATAAVLPHWPAQPVTTMLHQALPLLMMSIVLIVELVPVPLQVASVKLRKKRLFPFTPIHHAFERAGWPESRVVWMFAIVQFLCVAMGLTLALSNPPVTR